MTFLELVQRLASETGTELEAKVTSVETPPASAYGETTEHRSRLVRWIQQAWLDIQEDQQEWDFMIRRVTMPLARGQYKYDIEAIVNATLTPKYAGYTYDRLVPFVAPRDCRYIWVNDGCKNPPTRHMCYFEPPERFFGHYDRFLTRSMGIPGRYSLDRDGCIIFDVVPSSDELYLEFEYRCDLHELAEDADEPRGLPKRFHDVILYRAMLFYALFDESQMQVQRAQGLYRQKMNKLRLHQLRDYAMSGTFT